MMQNIAKNLCFPKKIYQLFLANLFVPKITLFLITNFSLRKPSISDYLSSKHSNVREKIQLNINRCELLFWSASNHREA